LKKTLENDARAGERGQQALDKLHVDMMQNENERNLHILHRFVWNFIPINRFFLMLFYVEKRHLN
jgi:hypothetical protein